VGFSEVGGHPLVDFDDSGLVLIRAEHLERDDAPAAARSPGGPRSSGTTRLSATPRPPAVEAAPPPPPPEWFARPPQPPGDEATHLRRNTRTRRSCPDPRPFPADGGLAFGTRSASGNRRCLAALIGFVETVERSRAARPARGSRGTHRHLRDTAPPVAHPGASGLSLSCDHGEDAWHA
jgi:hypothetical protein